MGEVNRKNVYVVGAGASTDFRLPVGSKLKNDIATYCDFQVDHFGSVRGGSQLLRTALEKLSRVQSDKFSLQTLVDASLDISRAMVLAPSIDNFLNTHAHRPEVVTVGKMAIVEAIAMAEKASTLKVAEGNIHNTLDFKRVKETWLAGLAGLLLSAPSLDDFVKAITNITFITFNYDRCIEQYFAWLGKAYFPDVGDASQRIYESLNIIHVYGSLGDLINNGDSYSGYGPNLDTNDIIQRSNLIRTFTEGAVEDGIEDRIAKAVVNCEVLVILGFAFHPMNVRLLPNVKLERAQRIIVTSRGFSRDDLVQLKSSIHSRFGHRPSFDAAEANNVFQEYRQFFLGRS